MAQVQQPQSDAEIDPMVELETQIDGLLVELERETKALDEIEARRKDAASRSRLMEPEPESASEPEATTEPASAAIDEALSEAGALNQVSTATTETTLDTRAIAERAEPAEERAIETMVSDATEQASAGEPMSPEPSAEAAIEESAATASEPAPALEETELAVATLDAEAPAEEPPTAAAEPKPDAAAIGTNEDGDLSAALTRALAEAENRAQELASQLGPEETAPVAEPALNGAASAESSVPDPLPVDSIGVEPVPTQIADSPAASADVEEKSAPVEPSAAAATEEPTGTSPESSPPPGDSGEPANGESIGVRSSFASESGESSAPAPVVGSATSISALDAELALGANDSTSNPEDEYAALEAALEQAAAQAAPAAGDEGLSLDELSDAVTNELTAAASGGSEPAPVAAASGFESVDDVVDKVLDTQAAAAQPPAGSKGAAAAAVIPHQAPTIPVMVAAAGVGTPPITESGAATAAALRSPTLAPAPAAKPAAGDALLKAHVVGTGNSIGRTIGALCNVFALPLKPFSGAVRDYVGYFGLITAFYGVCVIVFAFIRAANLPPEPDLPKLPDTAENANGHGHAPHSKDAHGHGGAHEEAHGDPAAPVELKHNEHSGHSEGVHHESAGHDAHAPGEPGAAEPHAEGAPAPEHHDPAEHSPPAKPH